MPETRQKLMMRKKIILLIKRGIKFELSRKIVIIFLIIPNFEININ